MKPAPQYELEYIHNYDRHNKKGNTLAGDMLGKSHEILERTLDPRRPHGKLIEVGSGTGEHIDYVAPNYDQYFMTDGNDEMLKLAADKFKGRFSDKLILDKQNATKLTYPDASFDRLIASHVLEHIVGPVDAMAEWNRVVRPGGTISIILPCDPGMLWRFGRHLGPRRRAQRMGVEYDYQQSAEHVNSIWNLVTFIRYHFDNRKETWWPVPFMPLPDINLFYTVHIYK